MVETFEYIPSGVCSTKINLEIEDNTIVSLSVTNGCNGNLKGISSLVKGRDVDEIISLLQGIDCNGKGTSCPDQISKALLAYKAQHS